MKIGMLWFDNDTKKSTQERAERAAAYYRDKYGQAPNICFVHPAMIPQDAPASNSIELRSHGSILPNHFWLGLEKP